MLKPKKKITRKEIRRDPLLEILYSVQRFYEEHRNRLKFGVAALAAVALVTLLVFNWKSSARQEANELLAEARARLETGQYQSAISSLQMLIGEYPSTSTGHDGLFYLGQAYLMQDSLGSAQLYFEEFLGTEGRDLLRPAALEALGLIAESDGNYAQAAQLFEQAASEAQPAFNSYLSSLHAAGSWISAGDYEQSRRILDRLSSLDFPNVTGVKNAYAEISDATKRLSAKLDVLASRSDDK